MVHLNEEPNSSGSADSGSSGSSGGSSCRFGPDKSDLRQWACPSAQQSSMRSFLNAISRKKPLDCRTETSLNRCLNLTDLTTLGVGSTLGLGLYVLAGQVASSKAGPAVVISFALAALASAFSALCYAEFAGRVPRAGSAYAYSYITVGEFAAFIIGWNLILEYVIGAASVARGFSGYVCFVVDLVAQSFAGQEQQASGAPIISLVNATKTLPALALTNSSGHLLAGAGQSPSLADSIAAYLAAYFDWPSVAIIVLITIFVLFGVKESTHVTLAFTALNLLVVLTVLVSSFGSLNTHNWNLSKSEVPDGFGEGGFLPYGWSGVLAGSATCFFGFIGFDTIASSAEEAKNPKRNVPLSIMLSLFISFLAYMAIASVQTLLWPYYDQNKVTILPYIFQRLDMPATYWIVLLGAIAGLASSQLAGMYPLPRIIYSMAQDKLVYHYLASVNRKLKLPVRATIVGSSFVALLSCLLDIQDLADMVSIGTLAAYSLVSLSVMILRYEDRSDLVDDSTILSTHLNPTDICAAAAAAAAAAAGENCAIQVAHFKRDLGGEARLEKAGCKDENGSQIQRTKLVAKDSAPIREKGSKPLVAQLSVGFNSWFNSNSDQNQKAAKGRSKQRTSLLDLLIVWRSSDGQLNANRAPDEHSSKQSKILIALAVLTTVGIDFIALKLLNSRAEEAPAGGLINPRFLLSSACCILLALLSAALLMLSRLPTSKSVPQDLFQVPLVPLVPSLSILVNTFLMLNLSYLTWLRFAVWMAAGLFIYFTYGIWNSEGFLLYNERRDSR